LEQYADSLLQRSLIQLAYCQQRCPLSGAVEGFAKYRTVPQRREIVTGTHAAGKGSK